MPVDVLSDVLKTVRLTGAAFFDVSATVRSSPNSRRATSSCPR